ncbi:tetratricopeptide repeat protein [Bradymonas sediminis]|uniref:Uncharacterized protein n=1 Tax=Bradymonas sediminis TaxID=1548548 RepID=A0A2Z4FMT2_9DELT|nr:tetratricopeptide repeat protein [Bradymonas sediminis]AWV90232.1 hypothetical protein DN745_13200 [Bradymonas sediminis]TDP75799.1 putative Zn finger-like uncharacterized protein [Bradymonas sediminis]
MNLTCPACSTPVSVDSSRVPADGLTVRCPQCAHSFLYIPKKAAAPAAPPAFGGPGRLGAPSSFGVRYFIKRPTGKIFGPFDTSAIRAMLDAGKLSVDAEVSPDQTDWQGLADVEAFADLAHTIAQRDNAPIPSQGFGRPTPGGTMLGAWADADESEGTDEDAALPRLAPPQLPRPQTSGSGLDLPKPQSPRLPGLPGLPTPSSASSDKATRPPQLPKRRELNLPSLKANLPKPKGMPGLPGVAPSLPASAGGLPQSKAADNLPGPQQSLPGRRTQDDLPATRAHELPVPAEAELPDLPTQEVTSWTHNNDLFGDPSPNEDLFADSPADDDLFADSPADDDLFADSPADDDLFGDAPADDDLFGDAPADDDLFGDAPADDDLFGDAPADDDLFGARDNNSSLFDAPSDVPAQHHASVESDAAGFDMGGALDANAFGDGADDLFDAPGQEEDDDDLFAAPGLGADDDLFEPSGLDLDDSSNLLENNDDFLSDDDNFTFLDEPSQPQQDDLAGMSGEWGDDLMSDAPVMDAFDSGRHDDASDWQQDEWSGGQSTSAPAAAPRFAAEAPIPESSEPRQPASRGVAAQVTRDEAVDADKKRGTMTMVGLSLLGVMLVGGIGYGVYNSFANSEPAQVEQPVAQKAAPARVDLAAVQSDTYGELRALIDTARKGKLGAEDQAKLLLAESLLLSRYDDADIQQHAESLAKPLADAAGGWEALARGAFEAQNGNADAARAYLEQLVDEDDEIAYFAHLLMGMGDALAVEKQLAPADASAAAPRAVQDTAEAAKEAEPTEVARSNEEAANEEAANEEAASGEDAPETAEAPEAVAKRDEANAPLNDAAKRIAARGDSALAAAQKLRPDAPAPQFWRAQMMAHTGDIDGAIKTWKAALKSSESHVASSLKLGEVFYERGDLNNASTELSGVTDKFQALAAPGERASALHLQGMIHVARQESDEAIKALTTALSIDVSRSDTIQALAEQYMSAEKYQEALNFFTTNKNLGAENPDVMLGIVRAYMGLEKWNDATEQLQRGAKLFPEDARFPLYLGRLHRDRLAYFDAQKALTQALKIDASLLSAHAALAQLIWITDKDLEAAQKHIKAVEAEPERIDAAVGTEVAKFYEMSKQRDLAEQRYAATLKRHPNYWPARLALARMYLDTQENEKALELLERAKAEGVKDLRLSAYLADAYRQSRHFAKAVDQINAVVAEHADNPHYIFIRGRIYFDQGNFDNAREDFIKAYELDTRFHDAYFYLGRTDFAQQDYAQAMKVFRHVLDYKPENGEYRYWMGRSYEAEKRLTSALDEYRKVTVVDPAFGQKNPEIFVRRGELLSKLGYSKKGKEDIATALRINPKMTQALVAMGNSDFRDKLYEDAIVNFQRALELDAEQAEVQYKLGMALMYTNREVKGAEHLQLAVRYGYEDPEVFQTLGYLYKRMNRRNAAIDSFKKYLTLVADKQSVTAKAKREIIQQIDELGGRL